MDKLTKTALTIIAIASVLILIGAFFKIMHWTGGETILAISLLTELLAGGALLIHLIRTKN